MIRPVVFDFEREKFGQIVVKVFREQNERSVAGLAVAVERKMSIHKSVEGDEALAD